MHPYTMAATEILTVRLPAAMRRQLDLLAKSTSRNRSWLAVRAIERYLSENAWQVAAIEEGVRAADAGDFIEDGEVEAWLGSWGKRSERKPPR